MNSMEPGSSSVTEAKCQGTAQVHLLPQKGKKTYLLPTGNSSHPSEAVLHTRDDRWRKLHRPHQNQTHSPSSNLQEQRADPSAQKRPPGQLTFLWQMSSTERGGNTLAETEEDA